MSPNKTMAIIIGTAVLIAWLLAYISPGPAICLGYPQSFMAHNCS